MGKLLEAAKAADEKATASKWNQAKTKIKYNGRKGLRNAPRNMVKGAAGGLGGLVGIPLLAEAATAAADKGIDGVKASYNKNKASKNGRYQTLEASNQAANSTDKVLGRKEAKAAMKDARTSLAKLIEQQPKLKDKLKKLQPIVEDIETLQCSQLPDEILEMAGRSNAAEQFLTELYMVPATHLVGIQRYQVKMRELRNKIAEDLAHVDAYLDKTEAAVAEALDQTEKAFEAHLRSVTNAAMQAARGGAAAPQAGGAAGSARPGVPGQQPGSPPPASQGVHGGAGAAPARPGHSPPLAPPPHNPRSRLKK